MGDKYYNLTDEQYNFLNWVLKDNTMKVEQYIGILTSFEIKRINNIIKQQIYLDNDKTLLNEIAEFYRNAK